MYGNVHIVRHAEGVHNLREDPDIKDAPLSQRGINRAKKLGERFIEQHSNRVGIIMSSPLRRAIQTSLFAFERVLDQNYYPPGSFHGTQQGIDLGLHPDLQEISDLPCNTGSERHVLKELFPALGPRIDLLDENWFVKQGPLDPNSNTELEARAERILTGVRTALQSLQFFAKEGRDVVIVTHEGIIKLITPSGTVLQPGEWATFTLESQEHGVVLTR